MSPFIVHSSGLRVEVLVPVEGSFILNVCFFSFSQSRRRIKIVIAQEQVGEVQCLEAEYQGSLLARQIRSNARHFPDQSPSTDDWKLKSNQYSHLLPSHPNG